MKLAFVAALLLPLLACGGQVTSTGDGGPGSSSSSGGSSASSSGTSSGVSSSSGGTVPPCPNDPPTVGDACTAPGQEGCAYFTGGACVAYVCGTDGIWQTTPQGC